MVSGFGWTVKADGAIAQLGERLLCKQEVVGSIPSGSTNSVRASVRKVARSAVGLKLEAHMLLPRAEIFAVGECRLRNFFYIVKRGST